MIQNGNSFSVDSKNQFMGEQKTANLPDEYVEMLNFMKNIYSDPVVREQMEMHMKAKRETERPHVAKSPMDTDRVNLEKQQDKVGTQLASKANINRNMKELQQRMAGMDVLSRYLPANSPRSVDKAGGNADSKDKPVQDTVKMAALRNFQDMPIKSGYINNMAEMKRTESYDTVDEKSNKSGLNADTTKSNNASQLFDERPICGLKKQFKEAIKEQFPLQYEQESNQQQQQPAVKRPTSNYLKRGSRQHLSSAMSKEKSVLTVQAEQQNREKPPTSQNNRSVSPNRILNRRPIQKSVKKDKPKQKDEVDQSYQEDEEQIMTRTTGPGIGRQNNLGKQNVVKAQKQMGNTGLDGFKLHSGISQGNQSKPKGKTKNPPLPGKKSRNVFEDGSSSQQQIDQCQDTEQEIKGDSKKGYGQLSSGVSSLSMIEAVKGVYITKQQLQEILKKYGNDSNSTMQLRMQELRNKYTDMCNLLEEERQSLQKKMEEEREQFQVQKIAELNKIKNEKRVMERQLKATMPLQQSNKERDELQQLKKQLEREREQSKKKDKNNRIIIQKLKKQLDEVKNKLEKEAESVSAFSQQQDKSSTTGHCLSSYDQGEVNKKYRNANNNLDYDSEYKQTVSVKNIVSKGKDSKEKGDNKDRSKDKVSKNSNEIKEKEKQVQIKVDSQQKTTNTRFDYEKTYEQNKDQKIGKPNLKYDYVAQEANRKKPAQEWGSQEEQRKQQEQEDSGEQIIEWTPAMKLSDLTKIPLNIKMVNEKMINGLLRFSSNAQYRKYQAAVNSPHRTVVHSSRNSLDGKVTNIYSDKSKEIFFENGTRKQCFEDGYTIIYFKNGDIKQKQSDGTVLYFFKDKEVDQITLTNGVNIYRFDNNQVEFHFSDGYIEIRHPDGTIKILGEK